MTYGKNQLALLKFLEKYPNRWHRIRRRKAIDAAKRLSDRDGCACITKFHDISEFYVYFDMPRILTEQN